MPKKPKDSDMIASVLGPKLRSLRKARRLTQEQVARAINCNTEYYARLERGHGLPSAPMLKAIADVFDVRVDDLLEDAITALPPQDIFEALPPKFRNIARHIAAQDSEYINVIRHLVNVSEARQGRSPDGGGNDDSDS